MTKNKLTILLAIFSFLLGLSFSITSPMWQIIAVSMLSTFIFNTCKELFFKG